MTDESSIGAHKANWSSMLYNSSLGLDPEATTDISQSMNTNPRLTIGALSERTEVNIETIRYYERIGILPSPPRSAGGHRVYAKEHTQRLVFIRRARQLGFSLDQVRELLGLSSGRRMTCARVKNITEQHITDIRRRVRDLKRLERVLSELTSQCRGDEMGECPILEALTRT
jgi:MerR family transcriptional regulator, mercuric resistance operon regulatory protein